MLARGAKSVSICSACQRNLFWTRTAPCKVGTWPDGPVFRRWYGAATNPVAQEDAYDADNSYGSYTTTRQPNDHHPPTESPQHHTSHDRHIHRRWMPSATLEVKSLGKSAEVLLLPPKNRRIAEAPARPQQGKDERGTSVQEWIASEKGTLSRAEVYEHIEQVRVNIGKMRGQLDPPEWTKLQSQLISGFAKRQLENYIRKEVPNLSHPRYPETSTRRALVQFIAEELWGFVLPVQEEPVVQGIQTQAAPARGKKPSNDRGIRHKLGSKSQAEQVPSTLSRIRFQDLLEPRFQSHVQAALPSIIDALRQKYPQIQIDPASQDIVLRYKEGSVERLEQRSIAEQVRRDAILAVLPFCRTYEPNVWPPLDQPTPFLDMPTLHQQPFPPPPESSSVLPDDLRAGSEWTRVVSLNASAPKGRLKAVKAIVEHLGHAFESNRQAGAEQPTRGGWYHHITARLGVALTKKVSADKAISSTSNPQSGLHTIRLFSGQIPYAAQHLAELDSEDDISHTRTLESDDQASVTLRLDLVPVPQPYQALEAGEPPSFEVFLKTSGSKNKGKSTKRRPKLEIQRVSAVHHEEHFTILCPHNQVDINFVRQEKEDIAYPGNLYQQDFDITMAALRKYIANVGHNDWSDFIFSPFVTMPAFNSNFSKTVQENTTEYILRTADIVGVDSHLISSSSRSPVEYERNELKSAPFCLDCITYTGSHNSRQEFRLAQRSRFPAPALKPPEPISFVRTALILAKFLSSEPASVSEQRKNVMTNTLASFARPAGPQTSVQAALVESSIQRSERKSSISPRAVAPTKRKVKSNKVASQPSKERNTARGPTSEGETLSANKADENETK
jgi:hypothetical protein